MSFLNSNNPGEIDDATILRTLSKRDALERVSGIYVAAEAQRLYDAAIDSGDQELIAALEARASLMGWPLTPGGTGNEAEKARMLLASLLNATLLAPAAVSAAEKFSDPRFTVTGLAEERNTRVSESVTALAEHVNGILTQIEAQAVKAGSRAAAVLPTFNPNDANQITRTAQAWEYTIKPVLDSDGLTNWSSLLDALDIDGLFAVQRFVPGWVKTQPITANLSSSLNQILEGAQTRIPLAATDSNVIALAANAAQANDYLAQAQAIANSLSGVKNSTDANALKGRVQRTSVIAGVANDIIWPDTQTAY